MKTKLMTLGLLLMVQLTLANTDPKKKEFNINDYAWLAGSWIGDGFGGTSEETWSLPSPDGTMMGMYRHHKGDGSLNFYEFMVLDKTGLRLKHFTPEMVGWETKEDFVTFEMVDFTPDKIELKGLTFERKSDSELEIRLKLKRGEKIETEIFNMKRIE